MDDHKISAEVAAEVTMNWARRKNDDAIALMNEAQDGRPDLPKGTHVGIMTAAIIQNMDHEHLAIIYAELIYEIVRCDREALPS